MSQTTLVIPIDADVKEQFNEFCEGMGSNVTEVINMFTKIVLRDGQIPFTMEKVDDSCILFTNSELEGMRSDTIDEDNANYEKLVDSLVGIIPPLPEGVDYREMIAQWRLEDYENLN